MHFEIITLLIFFLHISSCDWIRQALSWFNQQVSEWMSPIQEQLKENPAQRTGNDFVNHVFDVNNPRMAPVVESTEQTLNQQRSWSPKTEMSTGSLKDKLENTLQSAKALAETLKAQIKQLSLRENLLKEAIVNGRSGVTRVVVSAMNRPPRSYLVREGAWTLCRGVVRAPVPSHSVNMFNEVFAAPRCIGQEVFNQQDPCVFNSMIKYETVPTVRRMEYSEDDFICLKQSFNSTLERYLSVPRQIINDTCHDGTVRSLEENTAKCGLRVMSEYTYYPFRGYASGLPLEYCGEADGSCKLIMAWHVSNATIENFEFLKNEPEFKKFFIKSEGYLEHFI